MSLRVYYGFLLAVCALSVSSAQSESRVIAYDCNRTSLEVLTYDIGHVSECQEPSNTSYQEDVVNIQVIQANEYETLHIHRCKLIVSSLMWHCGMHGHSTIANYDFAPTPVKLSDVDCKRLVEAQTITLDARPYTEITSNTTHTWSSTITGAVWGEGNCEGGTFVTSHYTYRNVVVKRSYTLAVQDMYSVVKVGTQEVVGFSGLACEVSKGSCYDHEVGKMWWDIPQKGCNIQHYESLYSGIAKKITTDMLGNLPETFIHIKATDGKFQIFTPKSGTTNICGREVWTTPYNGLYLAYYWDEPRFPLNPPTTVNVDLVRYIEAKFMTFAYGITLTTHQIIRRMALDQCNTHRETLLNRLHIVASNPSSANLLVGNTPGVYGRVAGEVIHILQCPAVEVVLRRPDGCTLEIPITYMGEPMYMDPRTRIIMDIYTTSACSPLTPVMFRHGSQWLKMDPMFSSAPSPKTLQPKQGEYHEFQRLLAFSQGGIYDPRDLQQLRDFMLFSVRRDAMSSNILTGMEGKMAPKYDLTSVLDEEGWANIAKDHTRRLWGWFVGLGETISGFVGIYFCLVFIKVLIGIIIRTFSLYQVTGMSWKLVAGVWSALTQHILFKSASASHDIPLEAVETEDRSAGTDTAPCTAPMYPIITHD